jgi:IstB-like ATP binding protein
MNIRFAPVGITGCSRLVTLWEYPHSARNSDVCRCPAKPPAICSRVISRHEHGSIILTANRGIADWGHIFEDTTVATAVLDHSTSVLFVTGDSYRMRRHREAINALLPTPPGSGRAPLPSGYANRRPNRQSSPLSGSNLSKLR